MSESRSLARLVERDVSSGAFARRVASTALRRKGQIDAILRGFMRRVPSAGEDGAYEILLAASAQILFMGIAPHAATNLAVDSARGGMKRAINATLRRTAREGFGVAASQDAAILNAPPNLMRRWIRVYGESQARRIAESHLDDPPLDLSLRDDSESSRRLWSARLKGDRLSSGGIRLSATRRGAVSSLEGFSQGAWWVQDAAASLPTRLFGDMAGRSAFDACAAPGGKTLQLASSGARVLACDRSSRRLSRMRENLSRLGMEGRVRLIHGDAAEMSSSRLAGVDAILLDAPCGGSGTLRRRPDAGWIRRDSEMSGLRIEQRRLLRGCASRLRVGGVLVYSVCSLDPSEGEEAIEEFLVESRGSWRRLVVRPEEIGGDGEMISRRGDLRTFPFQNPGVSGGMDGFYAARLERLA